jgi:hypothetical protein
MVERRKNQYRRKEIPDLELGNLSRISCARCKRGQLGAARLNPVTEEAYAQGLHLRTRSQLVEWRAAMKPGFRAALALSLVLLCGSIAYGQELQTSGVTVIMGTGIGGEPIPAAVTGMPYSAVTEFETVQTAADGTRFDHKTTRSKTYRDSRGRSRTEHYIPTGLSNNDEPTVATVIIRDPIAGLAYILYPKDHTAEQRVMNVPPTRDRMNTDPRRLEITPRSDQPQTKMIVEDLGTQTIEGLVVQGKRTTKTIPSGAQGNDRPFNIVTERWFSKELELYILIKTNDPRSGENTIKTIVTDRGEPDPSLFQVPADYTIEQK